MRRRRLQTEGAASHHHHPSASVASSAITADAGGGNERPGGRLGGFSPMKRRGRVPFPKKLLRSKSAPYGGDAGTDSIRSDEASPAPPRPSVVAPALQSISGKRSDVDDGVPSESALQDLQRVVKLIEDERHLAAHELYSDARRRVEEARGEEGGAGVGQERQRAKGRRGRIWRMGPEGMAGASKASDAKDEEKAWEFLQERKEEFEALENRANLFTAAKENLSIDDDWIHAQTLFGVSTSYRREADGSLSVKIEGELHGVPLFEQLVVLRECDLYHMWAPFTSKSKKLAQLDKLDVVAWYIVGVPALGLTRDACYRAVGCDCMREDGSVLLVAVGLNDTEEYGVKDALKEEGGQLMGDAERDELRQQMAVPSESNLFDTTNSSFLARDAILSTLEIPPIPSGMGRGRMTIRNFVASIDILAPTAARTKMVVNVDPNLQFIPQFMVDFAMKRMCGILLSRLQATARKVVRDPISNAHARRMREDVQFYRRWLLPKFELYCSELGWQMPKVGAFEVDEMDLEAEGTSWIDDNLESDTWDASEQRLPDDESSRARTVSSSSEGSRAPKFLKKLVRASSASRLESIASSRQRASQRLRPLPFSDSKACRLNELKAAKMTAEERIRERLLRTSSGESVSSLLTSQTLQDVSLEGKVTRQLLIFGACFATYTALLLFRQYSLLNLSRWGTRTQEGVDIVLIFIQATSLRALVSGSFIFALREIDFGQRRLVENMGHGQRLFANHVGRVSFLVATSVSILSFGVGLFVQGICSPAEVEGVSPFSRWWKRLPRTALRKRLDDVTNEVWLPPMFPGAQKVITSISEAIKAISSAPLRACVSQAPASVQWSARALNVSSFLTLRIGVFVLSLMLMGYLLLPKPGKRLNENGREKTHRRGSPPLRVNAQISSFGSSLHDSQQYSGAEGHLSSMEVIAEEF